MINAKGNIVTSSVDGDCYTVSVKMTNKESYEPDELIIRVGRECRQYRAMFSCPIMGLSEWLSPFKTKREAIAFADDLAAAT